jgi:protein-tyrosine phosphatase
VASGFVDIHSHVLPGLDDGAKTLEDSVAMLRLAADAGTTDIVASPHANQEFTFDPEAIGRKIAEVQAAAGPLPRIHRGCDFHLTIDNIQDALSHPTKYAIGNKCYLLVEFSDFHIPPKTLEIFDRLQTAGLIPVVTHPERNGLLHTRLDQVQSWVENGAYVQVTGQSLLGTFGRTARSIAVELMNRNLVHFIASDGHDTSYRPPVLRQAFAEVERGWGRERAETLFITAPQAAIDGRPFTPPQAAMGRAKRKWYRLGF